MATRNTAHLNPWKILIFAILSCALIFGAAVAGGIYWFASSSRSQREQVLDFPAPRPVPRVESTISVARNDALPVRAPQAAFSKNAILAGQTNRPAALPGDDLFRDLVIPRLKITIPGDGMSALRRSERNYVRATIQDGETIYTNVAIRLKGGPGSFRPINDTPSFTVNFDHFVEGQKFHGLKKFHLNASVQDSSYIEEKISRELFEAAGVPVPRAGNAHVTLNGREMGMYVLIEGVNKQFLKRYFKDTSGNVYDGHSGNEVTDKIMEVNSGDAPKDQSARAALAAAIRTSTGSRLEALEKTLDIDRFLSYVAMEVILWHWDGYTMHRNNFRIFHDKTTDRMVFFPQGMDQMLGKSDGEIIPQEMGGGVARAVLQVPELRQRYADRVAEICATVFRPDVVGNRIIEVSEAIEEVMAETGNQKDVETQRQRANSFKRRVTRRAAYLNSQLFPAAPVSFTPLGTASFDDWEPQKDLGGDDVKFAKEHDPEGNSVLHISTEQGCTASWRTTKQLPAGKYRLEARIKTKGVVLDSNDPRAGAGLRISKVRTGQKNEGDSDWKDIAYEFDVPQEKDVELICELRADQGSIWYDLKSLKLTRL